MGGSHRVLVPYLVPSRLTFTRLGAELLRFEKSGSAAIVTVRIDGRCGSQIVDIHRTTMYKILLGHE